MPDTTWIYGLLCPETKKIRYVGASYQPVRRYKAHLSPTAAHDARNRPEDSREGWIASLVSRGNPPELVLLEEVEGRTASAGPKQPPAVEDAEYRWMRKLIAEGHPLTNLRLPPDLEGPSDSEIHQQALQRGRQLFGP